MPNPSPVSAAPTGAAPASKPSSSLLSVTMAALRGASPEAASAEETTDPANARREDSGDDYAPGEAPVASGGDDAESELDLTDSDDVEDADLGPDAETTDVDAGDEDGEAADDKGEDKPEASAAGGTEEVDITDDLGRRRVKVNFGDRDYMKKVVQQAAGARKLLRQTIPELKKQLTAKDAEITTVKEDAENFRGLAEAWDTGGIAGLIEKLTKGKQTWDQVFEAEKKQRDELAKLSSEARRAYDAEQRANRAESGKSEAEKKLEAKLKDLEAREEAAEKATLQSYMEASFTKSRFAGTLGDEAREHELDELLWDGVRAAIAKLPDDVVVTPILVKQTFARKAAALRSTIKTEARKEQTRVAAERKQDAKTAAQTAMTRAAANKPSSQDREFRKQLKSGDLVSAITGMLSRGKKQTK